MYLKRLELQGFKSFAHKTVLDFDPGMTAVVGPNGSGKSNVADSLRWVMGEQSLKLLRGKKSEDVIFAGSDKKSKLSVAEVSLTFDNKDRKIPVEYSEVVITRRLFRNGDSEYLMNNQRVRLLDVVDALMRSGFGATNYAVIGQGTIDQMILAGPAEIKNLVEEASGVKPYYLKREKTIRRLEQTEENLARVSELLQEIEPRLRSLKRQAKRMEEREAVANELLGLQLQYFGQQFFVLETDLKAITDRQQIKSAEVKKLDQETVEFEKTLEKEETQSGHTDNFLEELDGKLRKLEEHRLVLAEKLAEVKGKLKVEMPATKDFSGFKRSFEAILDLLRSDNVDEIKHKLKELVAVFGESKNEELSKQKETLSAELDTVVVEMNEQKRVKTQMLLDEKQKKGFLSAEEKRFRTKSLELGRLKDELNAILVDKARLDTRLESLQHQSRAALGLKFEELAAHKQPQIPADLINRISKLKHQLELTGGIDESTLNEFRETQQRFDYLSEQSTDLSRAVVDLRSVIDELDQIIKKQFDEAYDKISAKFSEYFRILFNGGRAQMSLLRAAKEQADEMEEIEEEATPIVAIDGGRLKKPAQEIAGIEIQATPPGKKLATIAALSGG